MASVLKVDALQGIASAGSITVTSEGGTATQSLQQGLAKVWVNFSGITVTIRDGLNATSLTDNGSGRFDVNHTNNMGNINYSVQVTSSYGGTDVGGVDDDDYINGIGTIRRVSGSTSTGSTKIITGPGFGTSVQDHAQSMTLVHGDLA